MQSNKLFTFILHLLCTRHHILIINIILNIIGFNQNNLGYR